MSLSKTTTETDSGYREIDAGGQRLKRGYLALMLWFVGRAICATARVDPVIKQEFESLPPRFGFSLGVMGTGLAMVVAKNDRGRVRYLGSNPPQDALSVRIHIKSVDAALRLFTFLESTAVSTCRDRLIVDGNLTQACAVIRVLDAVEVYLLPKPIAALAVKRYPNWPLTRKLLNRTQIYIRTLLGV